MLTRVKEIFAYKDMIRGLVKRDLRGRYKGSVLGFLWNFVNPSGKLVSKKWFINVNETFSEFGFTLVEVEKGLFNVVTTCATLVLNNNLNYNQFINALAPDKDQKGN